MALHWGQVNDMTFSAIASGGKCHWPKMLRKMPVLPITFLGGGSGGVGGIGGVGGGGDGVGGSVTGVTGNVGGCGGVTGGTGSGTGRSLIGVAGGGVSGKCGGARLAQRYLTTHPGTPCFDSFPRSVVFWVLFFEIWEDMLGAVSGPEHQWPVVLLVELHISSTF
jgi:hypothetical protein